MGITVQSSCIQPCMQLYTNHCAAMYTSVYYVLYTNHCAAICTFVHFCILLYTNHCAAMYTSVYYCTPTTVLLCTLLYTTVHQPLCCYVHFCILLQMPLNILYILSHSHTEGGNGPREDLLGAEGEWEV